MDQQQNFLSIGSKMKIGIIYRATNKINGKSYIGKTINFKSRKKGHIHDALRKNSKLYFHRAIRKYGKENFKWDILFEDYCHKNKLNSLEIFFIAYYNTFKDHGYNMTLGGEGGDTLSRHLNKKEIFNKLIKKGHETRIKNGTNIIASQNISRTLNKINPETGLTLAKENGKKISKHHNTLNIKTGLTYAQEAGKKQSITLNKIDSKTGLSIAKKRGLKISKTLKDNGSIKGKNNPMYNNGNKISGSKNGLAKKYLIISPNGQKIGAWGTLNKICKKYNLNSNKIYRYIDKGKIPEPSRYKNNIRMINCMGWSIYSLS